VIGGLICAASPAAKDNFAWQWALIFSSVGHLVYCGIAPVITRTSEWLPLVATSLASLLVP